jgi:DNA-directed RNA polymerase specialized sigma24 family protein
VETARQQQLDDLCRRFRPALVAYFLRRVRDPAEAEDLAHDVFVRLAGIPLSLSTVEKEIARATAYLMLDRESPR